jgi:hypothetical protein
MESREVLEKAARYYDVLVLLSTKDYTCLGLEEALQKDFQSIKNYIIKLSEAELVEVDKRPKIKGNSAKYIIRISQVGKFALKWVQDFQKQIETPSLEDAITKELGRILPMIEGDYNDKTIKYYSDILYKSMADTNYQAISSPLLKEFFERYINNPSHNNRIGECLSISMRMILRNIRLRQWFYDRIYPEIIKQIESKETAIDIRLGRVALMWQIFNYDEDKKREITKIFLHLLEQENYLGTQLCTAIYTYNMTKTNDIIQELIKLNVNKEIIDKFVH